MNDDALRRLILARAGEFAHVDVGPTMAFEIKRTPEAIERDDPAASFSAVGLDSLLSQIHSFVLSRLWREWEASGRPPRVMRVMVTVATSAEEEEE